MSHCVTTLNQPYSIDIKDAPCAYAQARVECSAKVCTIFLDKKLENIAPDSGAFLLLQGKEIIDITQKGISDKNKNQLQTNVLKQVAVSLAVFVFGLNYYSMHYPPAVLLSLPVWFLAHKLTNGANEHIKMEEVDLNLIEKANPKELKGGILFYKAWQKVNQKKNIFFFTSSGDSRFPSLESILNLKGRISQLEQKLRNQGINPQCTKEDKILIEKLEKLFDSNV